MATLRDANQAHLILKMKLSNYYWYNSSGVYAGDDDYVVIVHVKKIDNSIRKIIPQVLNDVSVKTEVAY